MVNFPVRAGQPFVALADFGPDVWIVEKGAWIGLVSDAVESGFEFPSMGLVCEQEHLQGLPAGRRLHGAALVPAQCGLQASKRSGAVLSEVQRGLPDLHHIGFRLVRSRGCDEVDHSSVL